MTAIPEVHAASIGFEGWHFDLTQSIEPWYLWEWMNYPPMQGRPAVFEYWANANGRQMQEWLDLTGRCAAIFDWNLQKMLMAMCNGNGGFDMSNLDHPSLLGLEPQHTVTFVESHDTYAPMKDLAEVGIRKDKELAYAYILFCDGTPMVYYHDYFLAPYHDGAPNPGNPKEGWPTGYFGSPLKPMIDQGIWVRQNCLAGSVQYVQTGSVEGDLFIAIRDGDGQKSGGMLALNDATSLRTTTVSTPWKSTLLRDVYSLNSGVDILTDATGQATVSLPARSYRLYVPLTALP